MDLRSHPTLLPSPKLCFSLHTFLSALILYRSPPAVTACTIPGSSDALLAAASASSFPAIPSWAFTQLIFVVLPFLLRRIAATAVKTTSPARAEVNHN